MSAFHARRFWRRHTLRRAFLGLGMLLALVGMLSFRQPTVLAATVSPHATMSAQGLIHQDRLIQPMRKQSPVARAASACAWDAWLTPERQTTHVGRSVAITEHWSCGPAAFQLIVFDFGDGSSSSYWCYVNCFAGSQTFTHSYRRSGTFGVYDGTWGGDYPSGTVLVLP